MENYSIVVSVLAAVILICAVTKLIKQRRPNQMVGEYDTSPLLILGRAKGNAQGLSELGFCRQTEPNERQNHLLALTDDISDAQRLYHLREYYQLARSGDTQPKSIRPTLH